MVNLQLVNQLSNLMILQVEKFCMRVLIYKRFVNVKICLNLIKDTDDFSRPICVLNPRLKVMDIVAEGIDIHHLASDKRDRKRHRNLV